jgi:hypothetical protein
MQDALQYLFERLQRLKCIAVSKKAFWLRENLPKVQRYSPIELSILPSGVKYIHLIHVMLTMQTLSQGLRELCLDPESRVPQAGYLCSCHDHVGSNHLITALIL